MARAEDVFEDPADVALADQLDVYYNEVIVSDVAHIIGKVNQGMPWPSISAEAKLQYWDIASQENPMDAVAILCYKYSAAMLKLAELSKELMDFFDEAEVIDEGPSDSGDQTDGQDPGV